jgi:protease-4
MERRSALRALAVAAGAGLLFFAAVFAVVYLTGLRETFGGPKVALVEVTGVITDSKEVTDQLEQHLQNPTVRAFLIRINSPGGGVAASQEIYEELLKIRRVHGKPVVASMGSLAASGGYYVASAADRILANPGTITGSIGVLMQIPNVTELLQKIGVRTVVIKSGAYKDLASATRELTPEERRILQSVLDDVHDQFIQAVADSRRIERGQVERLADGRIFSGRQAQELGLVDELGDLQDALARAGALGGIPGVPAVTQIERPRFSLLRLLTGWQFHEPWGLAGPGPSLTLAYLLHLP